MPIVYEDAGIIKSKDLFAVDPTNISIKKDNQTGKVSSFSIRALSLKKVNREIMIRRGMLNVYAIRIRDGLTLTNFDDPFIMLNEALNFPCDLNYRTFEKLIPARMIFWSHELSNAPFDREIEKFNHLKSILHSCVEDDTIIAVPEGYTGWLKKE